MKRIALVVLLATAPALAQEPTDSVSYRVKDGDTLALVAAEFYGDRRKAIFIMVKNKIAHPRALKNGERLKVPVPREITTSPNDTFETLAANYLGDARRGVFLAELNNLSAEAVLPAGTQLQIPFVVVHKADGAETLAAIGATFFGDKTQGDMLRRFNNLEKASIDKDESIQIPSVGVRLAKPGTLDAESKQRRDTRREAVQLASTNLPKAWQAWRSGETKTIEPLLSAIDIDYLDTSQAVEVAILRGLAAAADGNNAAAKESFKAARARNESHVLRKFDYSQKIIDLWKAAGGSSD